MLNEESNISERQSFSYISFKDLLDTPVEQEWIIEGMLMKGDATLIHAPGGVGKSMLGLYIALHLAAYGMDPTNPLNMIFGRFPVQKQRTTLFIQAENSTAVMHHRIQAMTTGNPALKNGLCRVFALCQYDDTTITGKCFSEPDFCDFVVQFINDIEVEEKIKIDILIIDPLISYLEGDENASIPTRETLDGISRISCQALCTPIVIHHANKGEKEKYRGSTAINDWARNRISLKHEDGLKIITGKDGNGKAEHGEKRIKLIRVTHQKCNNFQMFDSFLLEMDSNLCFNPANDQLKPKDVEDCKKVSQVLADIGGHAGSKNTLVKAYNDVFKGSPSTAKRIVDKAAENGFIRQETIIKEGKETHEYFSLEN